MHTPDSGRVNWSGCLSHQYSGNRISIIRFIWYWELNTISSVLSWLSFNLLFTIHFPTCDIYISSFSITFCNLLHVSGWKICIQLHVIRIAVVPYPMLFHYCMQWAHIKYERTGGALHMPYIICHA